MTGNREEMQNRVDTSMKVAAHRKVGDTGEKGLFFSLVKTYGGKKKPKKCQHSSLTPGIPMSRHGTLYLYTHYSPLRLYFVFKYFIL